MTPFLSHSNSFRSPPQALKPLVSFRVCSLRLHLLTRPGPSLTLAAADFTVPTSLTNAASSHAGPPRSEHGSLKLTLTQASTVLHVPASARLCRYSLELKLTLVYQPPSTTAVSFEPGSPHLPPWELPVQTSRTVMSKA